MEDLKQIAFLEQMGELNRTILRSSDAVFKINYIEMNDLKVVVGK